MAQSFCVKKIAYENFRGDQVKIDVIRGSFDFFRIE